MVNLVETEELDDEEIEDDAEELLQEAVQQQGGVAAVAEERRDPIVYLATTLALTRDLLARLQPAERVELLETYCAGCGDGLEEDEELFCAECDKTEGEDNGNSETNGADQGAPESQESEGGN